MDWFYWQGKKRDGGVSNILNVKFGIASWRVSSVVLLDAWKFTCEGLQTLFGVNLQGGSSGEEYRLCGKQHASLQSSSQPQSHSSPGSTTPLPQIDVCNSAKYIDTRARLIRVNARKHT